MSVSVLNLTAEEKKPKKQVISIKHIIEGSRNSFEQNEVKTALLSAVMHFCLSNFKLFFAGNLLPPG